jgi:ABC-type transporter Mla subunit MlaD
MRWLGLIALVVVALAIGLVVGSQLLPSRPREPPTPSQVLKAFEPDLRVFGAP